MKKPLCIKFTVALLLVNTLAFASFDDHPFGNPPNNIQMLSSFLLSARGNMADGNRVVFGAQYSNSVDGNDAIKLMNPGENFGLLRDSRILAVEARQPVKAGDSLFFSIAHLVPQIYKLEIVPENLVANGISCKLVDRYLNTITNISLSDSNHLLLTVTGDAASRAANRLMIVFESSVTAEPFSFKSITAKSMNDHSVRINWSGSSEQEVSHYQIERSADNIYFAALATEQAFAGSQAGNRHEYEDLVPLQSDNYYRIVSQDKYGRRLNSEVVKVSIKIPETFVSTYPNPVVNSTFDLALTRFTPGKYYLALSNSSGLMLYNIYVNVRDQQHVEKVMLDKRLPAGVYTLTVGSTGQVLYSRRIVLQ